jgi:hypothetical protein
MFMVKLIGPDWVKTQPARLLLMTAMGGKPKFRRPPSAEVDP